MNVSDAGQPILLELDLLRTVVAIAETGNFSSAAEVTFRTPSAVSMQVKKIEALLGKSIFKRDSRSVSLTPDGAHLLEHARRVLWLNRDIVSHFIAMDVHGIVRLGAPDDVAELRLPRFLKAFSESHPGVAIEVTVDGSRNMIREVGKQALDIAIITFGHGQADEQKAVPLCRDQLVWAGVRGGIACEMDPLPISVWDECCPWRQAGLASLEALGRDYRIAFRSQYISGQKAAVLSDLAVAPIPLSSCGGDIVPLGPDRNMPHLPEYELGMLVADGAIPAVQSAADHLHASFARDDL
ncbi:MAG TPA: LysR family transcriptional regulator [Gammaproteobacteria bacterium]|nr:LysR family transcriptional regulator [Gammaproteobacteria bacterium]